jgi:hypothetical protein
MQTIGEGKFSGAGKLDEVANQRAMSQGVAHLAATKKNAAFGLRRHVDARSGAGGTMELSSV